MGVFRLRGYRVTYFEPETTSDDPHINGTFSRKDHNMEQELKRNSYRRVIKTMEPTVLYCGDILGCDNVLVRVHDQCQTSEVMGSLRCDCKQQLDLAMKKL